jgi:signal transduction histidine kinase/ActR/RegA family two-component response regulator
MPVSDPLPPPPSRAVSLAVTVGLIALWGTIRLVVFDTLMFPLTYAIPLLVCVWTRDRVALWGMAVVFALLHAFKLLWLLPADALTAQQTFANATATLLNIVIGATVVHTLITIRMRLESALSELHGQSEELRAQSEELAQQNEELTEQAEELSVQTEELVQQGNELTSQNDALVTVSEELSAVNGTLRRRERLLETLLETARLAGVEETALQHIVNAAIELFGEHGNTVAIYEKTTGGFLVLAAATGTAIHEPTREVVQDHFAALVVHENRTAALNDLSLRSDLVPTAFLSADAVRAVLCAPIRSGGRSLGAFAIYSSRPLDWSSEQFRLAEWMADQCSRALQAVRVQQELREGDQRKSEFLATLSHELRNPLAPIRFALNLLEQGEGNLDNAVRIMQRQVQQLVRLVDDLLDATRLSSGKIQLRKAPMDLVLTVRQAVEASRPDIEAAGQSLVLRLPTSPLWLDADADRLSQVVTNLLNNATRYTPPGGEVTIEVTVTGERAVLTLADSGIGIQAEHLERVFDMFSQVDGPGSGGLGIGLAIVRGIVEMHGGQVAATSDGVGRGSQFRVTLPLALAETRPAEVAVLRTASGLPKRVLVVDDNTDAAAMLAAFLEMHGHTVAVAHDAGGALEAAGRLEPEVALLDIGLPGIDGYELARRFRESEQTRAIRLVAVTGWGQDTDRQRARDAGFDAHFTKPAEPGMLLAVVHGDGGATGNMSLPAE